MFWTPIDGMGSEARGMIKRHLDPLCTDQLAPIDGAKSYGVKVVVCFPGPSVQQSNPIPTGTTHPSLMSAIDEVSLKVDETVDLAGALNILHDKFLGRAKKVIGPTPNGRASLDTLLAIEGRREPTRRPCAITAEQA